MSQRALNKAVKWSWSELQVRDNDRLRVVLLTERDILLYSAVASAVYWQTRWQDVPASFADVEQYATEALKRLLMPIDICELVADCIRDSDKVQEALQGETGNGYGPKTIINNTQYTQNVFISGDGDGNGCSNDAKFGRIIALVEFIDEVMLDFFQVLDAVTNVISQLDELISAVPVFETLPIDEAIGVIGSTGEFWKDSYDASVNTQLLERIECELWCEYGTDCDITVGDVRQLILERYNLNSTQGALNVFSAFAVFARIAGTIAAGGVGTYVGDDFVYLSWLLQLSAIEATGSFFGVDPIDYVSTASNGTPNTGWSLCVCDTWISELENCQYFDDWTPTVTTNQTCSNGVYRAEQMGWELAFTATNITRVDTTTWQEAPVANRAKYTVRLSLNGSIVKEVERDFGQEVAGETDTAIIVNATCDEILVFIRADSNPTSNRCEIRAIKVQGTGTKPAGFY